MVISQHYAKLQTFWIYSPEISYWAEVAVNGSAFWFFYGRWMKPDETLQIGVREKRGQRDSQH